jgi:hypothetical protein
LSRCPTLTFRDRSTRGVPSGFNSRARSIAVALRGFDITRARRIQAANRIISLTPTLDVKLTFVYEIPHKALHVSPYVVVSRGCIRRCRFQDRVAIARLSRRLQPYFDPPSRCSRGPSKMTPASASPRCIGNRPAAHAIPRRPPHSVSRPPKISAGGLGRRDLSPLHVRSAIARNLPRIFSI